MDEAETITINLDSTDCGRNAVIAAYIDALALHHVRHAATATKEECLKLADDLAEKYDCSVAVEIPPAPPPASTALPACPGLAFTAQDGERLGRLAWVPGAR